MDCARSVRRVSAKAVTIPRHAKVQGESELARNDALRWRRSICGCEPEVQSDFKRQQPRPGGFGCNQ